MDHIKNNIIDKINSIDDINLINALNIMLDNLQTPPKQQLQAGEKNLLQLGLSDYKQGKVIDDATVRKEEDEWLNG